MGILDRVSPYVVSSCLYRLGGVPDLPDRGFTGSLDPTDPEEALPWGVPNVANIQRIHEPLGRGLRIRSILDSGGDGGQLLLATAYRHFVPAVGIRCRSGEANEQMRRRLPGDGVSREVGKLEDFGVGAAAGSGDHANSARNESDQVQVANDWQCLCECDVFLALGARNLLMPSP